ncbi:MAG: SRPBCC domain-containing protein [Cytophagaceae bacterium]
MKGIIISVIIISIFWGCQTSTTTELSDSTKINSMKMENKSFTSTIIVSKSPADVFKSIQNFRGWWSEEIEGKTDSLNEVFFYHYKDIHLCKMKLVEATPNQKVVYKVVENEFNFVEDKTEWVNTLLVFDILSENGKTKVVFTHEGLVPEYACYEVCNDAWTGYIQNSLKSYIETGIGTPNPKDKDGFNAELAKKWKLD